MHSFSSCPLKNASLLVTNHKTKKIISATDELLDLLGYTLTELSGQSIHVFQLSCNLNTFIPECLIQQANGNFLNFQVCLHQLNENNCLDYWLVKPILTAQNKTLDNTVLSIITISSFGTIEQVKLAHDFNKQSIHELLGKPIMAFIYQDDVQSLCSMLSNHKIEPILLRWSKFPCLLSATDIEQEDSLNYDWMSFSAFHHDQNKKICILRSLQINYHEQQHVKQTMMDYTKDFYYYVLYNLMQFLTSFKQVKLLIQYQENNNGFVWSMIKYVFNIDPSFHSYLKK